MPSGAEAEDRASRFLYAVTAIGLAALITAALITGLVIAVNAVVDLISANLPPMD